MGKARWEMSMDELIADAGWFHGTQREWELIPYEERKLTAFRATGCLIAYATWTAPVECYHPDCQIARGEKPAIYKAECVIEGERSNWLRFLSEEKYQHIRSVLLAECERLNIYNPWQLPGGWQAFVGCGLA